MSAETEPESTRAARAAYADGVGVVEEALGDAARAQWDGRRADLHRQRRRLIEARRTVPNDRDDPVAQVVRDLLTCYANVLDELAQRTSYHRELELSPELRDELGRLRRRASRFGLPVLDDSRSEFRTPRREPTTRPSAPAGRPRGARPAQRPAPAAPAPAAAAGEGEAGAPKRRRRRRRSRGGAGAPTT